MLQRACQFGQRKFNNSNGRTFGLGKTTAFDLDGGTAVGRPIFRFNGNDNGNGGKGVDQRERKCGFVFKGTETDLDLGWPIVCGWSVVVMAWCSCNSIVGGHGKGTQEAVVFDNYSGLDQILPCTEMGGQCGWIISVQGSETYPIGIGRRIGGWIEPNGHGGSSGENAGVGN